MLIFFVTMLILEAIALMVSWRTWRATDKEIKRQRAAQQWIQSRFAAMDELNREALEKSKKLEEQ